MAEPEVLGQSRKRPLDTDIQNTPFYKMHTIIKDLRPHFIEVLKTPDFQNCKAADEIRRSMKLFTELCKQMQSECIKLENCINMPGPTDQHTPTEYQQDLKPTEESLDNRTPQGSYIIGGSAFGWNFVTCQGGEAVYYGQTKEAFRALNPKPEE